MDGFRQHFEWDNSNGTTVVSKSKEALDKGMINGFFGAGAAIGAIINPAIADRFGRRPCLFSSTVTFIAGAAVQASAVRCPFLCPCVATARARRGCDSCI